MRTEATLVKRAVSTVAGMIIVVLFGSCSPTNQLGTPVGGGEVDGVRWRLFVRPEGELFCLRVAFGSRSSQSCGFRLTRGEFGAAASVLDGTQVLLGPTPKEATRVRLELEGGERRDRGGWPGLAFSN